MYVLNLNFSIKVIYTLQRFSAKQEICLYYSFNIVTKYFTLKVKDSGFGLKL